MTRQPRHNAITIRQMPAACPGVFQRNGSSPMIQHSHPIARMLTAKDRGITALAWATPDTAPFTGIPSPDQRDGNLSLGYRPRRAAGDIKKARTKRASPLAGQAPYLNALNERLRDDYVRDAVAGIERWDNILQKQGIPFTLTAPHKAFNPLRSRMDAPSPRMAALGRGSRLRQLADGPGRGAGQVRQLDRTARTRHQQSADRLRVRPLQLTLMAQSITRRR
ncbi:MAG: benzoyl-CoA 2,3-dioxygenase component B [Rhodocyclaceae bacterium]|nr:MAG: benzoyl-CoA 2,3-dioxygenase component B [Rhodocyclaceae bacterium]